VTTGTVPEVATQTPFTPSADLISGMTYYWRVQASDTTKGVVGGYSSGQAFTTVFPEDGTFRYTFAVHSPSWCLTHYTTAGPCGGGHKAFWIQVDRSYDVPLIVDGETLRFTLPKPQYVFGGPLAFTIQRANNRLGGDISGSTDGPPADAVIFGGTVSGQADNQGHFDGTLDRGMGLWFFGFPCDATAACLTSGFTWTLTPH
jgi:hypothetical protein